MTLVPDGWKLVPIEPTPEMRAAYTRAISNHIESLPENERNRVKGKPHGMRIKAKLKLKLRWVAMLAAAPKPNS
jgi:hypothetical protein